MSTTDPDRHFVADDGYVEGQDLQQLDRADLDASLIRDGAIPDLVADRAGRGGAAALMAALNLASAGNTGALEHHTCANR